MDILFVTNAILCQVTDIAGDDSEKEVNEVQNSSQEVCLNVNRTREKCSQSETRSTRLGQFNVSEGSERSTSIK